MLINKGNAQVTFQKSFGSTLGNAYIGTNDVSVLQTYDGGYCLGGTINANNGDIFLLKLNSIGDTLWTKTFGGNFDDILFSVAQTFDSGFILAGQTRSFSTGITDAYLIRTDASGNLVWSKNYGGFDSEWFSSIQQTDDSGFIACGSTFTFGSGIQDIYLVKIDPFGNIKWTKTIGGSGWDRASSIQQTFDKGFIITGSTTSFTAASGRIYLVKTDKNGSLVWSNILGGVMGEGGHCVRQCKDSSFVVTGYTNSFGAGAQDVFLLKTDESGNLQWMKTYGGVWEDIGYHVEQTSENGFIVTGRTQSFGSGSGVYLLKTNAIGDTLWTRAYGNIISNGYCVKQSNDGGYIIASNPNTLNAIKTDSFGHVGCNEYNTNTIINSISPVQLTGALTGSGGIANNAATITRYTPVTFGALCLATNIGDAFIEPNKINVYPNPFADRLTFTSSKNEQATIILFDIFFRQILQQTFTNSTTINTEHLADGIYFYELRNSNLIIANGKAIKH